MYTFDSQYEFFIISCENASEINKNDASTRTSPYCTQHCVIGAPEGVCQGSAPSDFTDVDKKTEAEINSLLMY